MKILICISPEDNNKEKQCNKMNDKDNSKNKAEQVLPCFINSKANPVQLPVY
jgi:hypothetical protein